MTDLSAAEYAALCPEDRAYVDMLRARRAARENACAVCAQPIGPGWLNNAQGQPCHTRCLESRPSSLTE